ncbi:hypothetical protein AAKU64_004547, partial [Undibacterium sp. GrIS 1.8]
QRSDLGDEFTWRQYQIALLATRLRFGTVVE